EALRACCALGSYRRNAVVPLAPHAFADRLALLRINRAAIRAHAGRREARDLVRHPLGKLARAAVGHHVLARADPQRLFRGYLAPGHDDLERAAGTDNARQSHSATVDQGHAPAPAIDAEVGRLLHNANVAPERRLESAGNRRAGDSGDHRLVELESRRTERATR